MLSFKVSSKQVNVGFYHTGNNIFLLLINSLIISVLLKAFYDQAENSHKMHLDPVLVNIITIS